jgi:integrase
MLDRHVLPRFGSRKVADLSRADIERLHLSLKATPYMANRTLSLLGKLFVLAIAAGLRTDNPCRGIVRFDEQRRERWLGDEELARLLDVLNAHANKRVAAAIKLILLTGARRTEALSAKWEDFDLQRGVWTKPSHHTKQKKTEHVPLSASAIQLLTSLRAHDAEDADYLFAGKIEGQPIVEIKKIWATIRKLAKLEGVRLHDLRHTFASHLVSSGLSLHIVGALLGHTQPGTTARYAHLADDALRHAANRFGSKISGLGGLKTAAKALAPAATLRGGL